MKNIKLSKTPSVVSGGLYKEVQFEA
ncbi:uncharacterized protein METZ01_LOCUS325541 [marine metagenome]|uniref:Uncharacterized protein n=1 Tax=marine metagenome TaxID=408172 RepID=A0A382PIM1_9ZZZZ